MLLVYVSTNGTVNKDFYGNAIRLRWCTCHWVSARCDHRQDDDIVPCACSGRVHAWRPSGEDRAMNGKLTCRCRRFHAHSPRIPCSHLSPLVAYTCSGPAASQPAGDVAVTCCSSWSDTNCHSTRSMHLTPSLPTIISVHISCISYFLGCVIVEAVSCMSDCLSVCLSDCQFVDYFVCLPSWWINVYISHRLLEVTQCHIYFSCHCTGLPNSFSPYL